MLKRMWMFVICGMVALAAGPDVPKSPTYSKDVARILNDRCVVCHRAGEIGPMALTSYKEARPWAKAIRDAVAERKMPPWHADPSIGKWANDRRLTDGQIQTISLWATNGAPEGNTKDLPKAPTFPEGWNMGKPDVEIKIPKPVDVPAEGVVDYLHVTAPTNFTEDKWVQAAEIRPGNRAVVHHVIAFVMPPEGEPPMSQVMRDMMRYGTACEESRPNAATMKRFSERARSGRGGGGFGVHLVGWAPGLQAAVYPEGSGKLIRAGSRIMFQLHYTPNGKAGTDSETKVGLIFAKGPVTKTVHTMGISNMNLAIPPGDGNYESKSCYTFSKDVTLTSFMPHMHLRGKDMTYKVTFPDGRTDTLLWVPKYDFSWQTYYSLAQALTLPKGTRIDCTAHHDNSANNKYNPDASKEVYWGDQTWEEMMIGWVTFTADRDPAPAPTGGSGSN